MLAESVLHALVETKTLTRDQAIGAVRTACDVKVDVAEHTGESSTRMQESLGLLNGIERTFNAGEDRAG